MERTGILAAAIAEGVATLEAGLREIGETVLQSDLLTGERALQQVLRAVGSAVESVVLAQRAQGPEGRRAGVRGAAGRCTWWGGSGSGRCWGWWGSTGSARPTFHCVACQAGHAPLDTSSGWARSVWGAESPDSSSLPVIIVQDAAEDVAAANRPGARTARERDRTALTQPLVRAPFVIEVRVRGEHPQQVALIEDEQVVQALAADAADPALRVAVRPGAEARRWLKVHGGGPGPGCQRRTVAGLTSRQGWRAKGSAMRGPGYSAA